MPTGACAAPAPAGHYEPPTDPEAALPAPQIRLAGPDDAAPLAATLAAAFAADPFVRWLIPSDRRYAWAAVRAFDLWLRRVYLPMGAVYATDELTSAALWAPPDRGQGPSRRRLGLLLGLARIFGRGLPRALRGYGQIDGQRPDAAPHWHLAALGTHPDHRGRGLGSAVMEPVLARCDWDREPAYLETALERNLGLYRRHGFEVAGALDLPGGPRIWRMWREPARGGAGSRDGDQSISS